MNLQKHMNALLGKKPVETATSDDELTDLLIDMNDDDVMDIAVASKSDTHAPTSSERHSDGTMLSHSEILQQALLSDNDLATVIIAPDGAVLTPTQGVCALVSGSESHDQINSFAALTAFYADHLDIRGDETTVLENVLLHQADTHLDSPTGVSSMWTSTMKDGRVLRIRTKYAPSGHLVIFVNDVTATDNELKLLRLGMQMGTSGYWTFEYHTGEIACSEYIRNALSDEELERTRQSGLLALVHPEDSDNATVAFLQAQSNNTQLNGTYRIVTEKAGLMWVNIIGEFQKFSKDGSTGRFIAYINDVTKDVTHRQEIEDAHALSNAKTQFFARMSHEIKTPLNAIVGMTDALMDELDNDEAKETARYISDAANSLDSVLTQTLEHARLSSNHLVLDIMQSDVRDIVRSTCALFKKQCLNKGLQLSVRISDTVPDTIETDPTRLRQCLTNLLSNAVKFTQTGRIDVALAMVDANTPAPRLVMAVKDSGIGMSAKQVDNIFMPFAQADETIRRRFGGAGLGMAITRQIVEAMSGDIRVKSRPDDGTTVLISMPSKIRQQEHPQTSVSNMQSGAEASAKTASPEMANAVRHNTTTVAVNERASQASPTTTAQTVPATHANTTPATTPLAATPEPSLTAADLSNEKAAPQISKKVPIKPTNYSGFDILVVEDNPINQKVVGKLLAGHVRSISFAFNGEEALAILERQPFNVILMDIHMPGKDGIETTLEIRNSGKAYADIVIVALTADPDYQQKRICRNIGMNDTIGKPVRRQDLLDAMERVLEERATGAEKAA